MGQESCNLCQHVLIPTPLMCLLFYCGRGQADAKELRCCRLCRPLVIRFVSVCERMSVLSQKYPKYTLEVKATDVEGRGLSGVAKVILTVTDSNDNAPAFTQSSVSTTNLPAQHPELA